HRQRPGQPLLADGQSRLTAPRRGGRAVALAGNKRNTQRQRDEGQARPFWGGLGPFGPGPRLPGPPADVPRDPAPGKPSAPDRTDGSPGVRGMGRMMANFSVTLTWRPGGTGSGEVDRERDGRHPAGPESGAG